MADPVELARVIVPLDTSATAEAVLPWAALMARDHGMEVALVAVWSENAPVPGINSSGGEASARAALEAYLKDVAARPVFAGARITTEVRSGDVSREIAAAAAEHPGSIILICTHGEGGYQEAYIGSVTDRLVRTAKAPVLLISASAPQ